VKICELKINNYQDLQNIVMALVKAGYKVSIDERKNDPFVYWSKSDYYVVVEEVGDGE